MKEEGEIGGELKLYYTILQIESLYREFYTNPSKLYFSELKPSLPPREEELYMQYKRYSDQTIRYALNPPSLSSEQLLTAEIIRNKCITLVIYLYREFRDRFPGNASLIPYSIESFDRDAKVYGWLEAKSKDELLVHYKNRHSGEVISISLGLVGKDNITYFPNPVHGITTSLREYDQVKFYLEHLMRGVK